MNGMRDPLPPVQSFLPAVEMGIHAIVYLVGALLCTFLINWATGRFERFTNQMRRDRGTAASEERHKQTATIATTTRRALVLLVWVFAVIMALRELRFDVAPLLAGAGVAGLAIGFAAQNLLRDTLSGIFLLAEGHIRINDVVKIDAFTGTVEEITLRTVVLRGLDGAVHVISNGSINSFSNLTNLYSFHVIELTIDLSQDPEPVHAVLGSVGAELAADPEFARYLLAPIEILGLDRFTQQGMVIKARLKTLPNERWTVGREFNRRLKHALDRAQISMVTTQRPGPAEPVLDSSVPASAKSEEENPRV
jgi:small conductance mechanosensitive channel